MQEVPGQGPVKVRSIYRLGSGPFALRLGCHNSSLANARRALVERVYFVERDGALVPPPRPAPGAFERNLRGQFNQFRRLLPQLVPRTLEEAVAVYQGDRRYRVYAQAYESLLVAPISASDALLSSFTKCEKVDFGAKEDPAPRLIQARKPRYNLELGRYLRPAEKVIYRAIDRMFGDPVVCKGLNASERGELLADCWSDFSDPVAVGLDASRFDQHVSMDALRWEHAVYELVYPGDSHLKDLLSWQRRNFGVVKCSDGVVKYRVDGSRMSGDMNTSLGNVLLMCAMLMAYITLRGIRCRVVNDGDDCVVFLERSDLEAFTAGLKSWFEGMGFTMKMEDPVYELEKVEFCKSQPVKLGDSWVMVRKLDALSKDLHSVIPLDSEKRRRQFARSIGECGLALAGSIPIYCEFYKRLLELGGPTGLGRHPQTELGLFWASRGMDMGYGKPSDETRVSFYRAFGVTPHLQEQIEKELTCWEVDMVSQPRREIVPHSVTTSFI